jgi:hypothetical protein
MALIVDLAEIQWAMSNLLYFAVTPHMNSYQRIILCLLAEVRLFPLPLESSLPRLGYRWKFRETPPKLLDIRMCRGFPSHLVLEISAPSHLRQLRHIWRHGLLGSHLLMSMATDALFEALSKRPRRPS